MNNSKIIKDNILEAPENIDNSALYRQQEQELLEVIEALEHIKASNYWKLLEQKMLTPTLLTAQRKLNKESDVNKIFHLQGQIEWLESFSNLNNLLLGMRNRLSSVRNSLKQ